MIQYPVRLIPGDGGSVTLVFPDIPDVSVVGTSENDAFEQAGPILESALGGYDVDGRPLPAPSDICGAPTVATRQFSLVGMDPISP